MNIEDFGHTIAQILDFYDYLTKATPAVLVLVASLGFYYREKLKAILAKSLSSDIERLKKEFAKEIADHAAALQRELEAYRVSLIADAERIKAEQDVRKSIALRVAEKRFDAISRLLDAHLGIDTDIGALLSHPQSEDASQVMPFLKRRQELLDRLSKYSTASDGALLFISMDMRQQVLAVRQAAIKAIGLRTSIQERAVGHDHPDVAAVLDSAHQLEQKLRSMLTEFEKP